jgi:hypothetical protein
VIFQVQSNVKREDFEEQQMPQKKVIQGATKQTLAVPFAEKVMNAQSPSLDRYHIQYLLQRNKRKKRKRLPIPSAMIF